VSSEYEKFTTEVASISDVIWDMATKVWTFAELGLEEVKSSKYESDVLEKSGFSVSDRGIGGLDTSWVATYGSGSPTLGILVEFDALPGLGNETAPSKTPRKDGGTSGHGCGHNLIGSGSIGSALALKAIIEKEQLQGTIKVFGCPAEELLCGKNYMAKAGAFDGIDACLHFHPMMVNTVWNIKTTATADFSLEWHGKTAHAGATPWAGRSALHAAELFTSAANMMREQMHPESRLHYIYESGGIAVNVIPDYSKLLVRYRGPSAEDMLYYSEWIKEMAKGAAMATKTEVTITQLAAAYDTLPNQPLADRMHQHFTNLGAPEFTTEEQTFAKSIQKEMGIKEDGMATDVYPDPKGVHNGGSSDLGDVSYCVPTMGVIVASWPVGIPPHQWGCTACNGMSIGQKAALKAAEVMTATGYDILTDPDLLNAAKEDFEQRSEGKPYKNLCENDKPAGGHRSNAMHEGHDQALVELAEHVKALVGLAGQISKSQ
jgi:aminobenzoyl-glutamate utilization protein B